MAAKALVSFGPRKQVLGGDVSKASLIRQHLEGFGGTQQQNCDFHVAAFAFFTQKGIKST